MWLGSNNSSENGLWYRSPWFPDLLVHSIATPSLTWSPFTSTVDDLSWIRSVLGEEGPISESEEKPEMKIYNEIREQTLKREYRVVCSDMKDLLQDRILKHLSVMKSELMMTCLPVKVDNIECKMTPKVKDNIIQAWRRIGMYGKKTPFVARFDEYGRQLPDEIKINTLKGMDIKIVDPKDYGDFYLEFTGIVPDKIITNHEDSKFTYKKDDSVFDEDLPF